MLSSRGKIHPDTRPCAWVSWQGPQATKRSLKVLKFVGRKSKVPAAAGPVQHVQLCLGCVLGLGTNTWEGARRSATLWAIRRQGMDASVSKIKLSSSCLLYCTSITCCYSENRTDSSSGGTTAVNKATQANSLLKICSLWTHGGLQHNGDHHWWGASLSPSLKSQSHQNTTDQLKFCSLETVAMGKLQHPPFPKQEMVALY